MKNQRMRWLPLLLLATIGFLFPACEGNNPNHNDDETVNYSTMLLPSSFGLIYTQYSQNEHDRIIVEKGRMYWQEGSLGEGHDDFVDQVQFICMGKMKSIYEIKTVPANGWQPDSIQIEEGEGYLIRCHAPRYGQWFYHRFYVHDYFEIGGVDCYYHFQLDSWDPLADM